MTASTPLHVTANVTRDGKWWMVDVPGFGLTQARHVSEVDAVARSLVAVICDVDEDAVIVTVVR